MTAASTAERTADLAADLARRHGINPPATLTDRSHRMIRVHMNPEISTQPKEYPTGTDWELTENGTLLVVAKSTYIAQFGVDTWTHVEIVQAGDAA